MQNIARIHDPRRWVARATRNKAAASPGAPSYGNSVAGRALLLDRAGDVVQVQIFGQPPQLYR
jgi:hypothetical protein